MKLVHGIGGIRLGKTRPDLGALSVTEVLPDYIRLPVDGYLGERLSPAVSVGDRVLRGQLIAGGDGEFGIPVYSGISGTVTTFEEETDRSGEKRHYAVIRGDGEGRKTKARPQSRTLADTPSEELVSFARWTGICGMDGFPLWKNLEQCSGGIRNLIICAVPCDPADLAFAGTVAENTERLVCGIKIVMKAVSARLATIIMPESFRLLSERLKEYIKADGSEELFRIAFAPDIYPFYTDERLIRAVGGNPPAPGERPQSVGYAIFDAVACARLFTSFADGMPQTDVTVSVGGDCVRAVKRLKLPVGTEISYIEKICGGFFEAPLRIIDGGRMKGRLCRMSDVVTRDTRLLQFDCTIESRETAGCIRCGRCVAACPSGLAPLYLSEYSKKKDIKKCLRFGISSCTECGCCSYVCPSGITLTKNIRIGKLLVAEDMNEDERAEFIEGR